MTIPSVGNSISSMHFSTSYMSSKYKLRLVRLNFGHNYWFIFIYELFNTYRSKDDFRLKLILMLSNFDE